MKPISTHTTVLLSRFGLLFLCSFFIVQYPISTALAQPPAPHDAEQDGVSYEDCVYCHHAGKDAAPLVAVDHIEYGNADCRVCHGTTGMRDTPHISHPIAGWEDCRGCHERWDGDSVEIPNLADSDYDHTIYESGTCTSCHPMASDTYDGIPLASCGVCHPESVAAETVHNGLESWVDCADCHEAADHYPHDLARMQARDADCIICHYEREGHWTSDKPARDERYSLSDHVARDDPHTRVDCTACHLQTAAVQRDPITGRIHVVPPETKEGVPPDDPDLANVDKVVDCYQRCHFVNNTITAPAAELPPRGVLCLACHSASPVVRDSLSWVGLTVFGVGMLVVASVWVQGSVGQRRSVRILVKSLDLFSLPHLVWLFVMNRVLRKDLFYKNKARWLAHVCMLFGIAARAALGLFTWAMMLLAPITPLTQTLVNKNAPFTTLVYDGLGVLVIVGAVVTILQRFIIKDKQATAQQDTIAVILVVTIFLMGFIVKGSRILIADLQPSLAAFSFIGYPISLLLGLIPINWGIVYGWLWYVHAGLVATLVAYLPFSKFIRFRSPPI
ncbi:MAG: cytochrome c3 family protein [Chloroflexi bacterium]|nr:cytochrome c3 family protein [Chloroflexota bacterium]